MHRKLSAVLAAAALLLAACGDDDDETTTGSGDTTTTAEAPSTTAAEPQDPATDAGDDPERVVSLAPTATEILFAVGAGDQVVAVDDQSDFPEGVPVTDLSSYEPNLEAVLGYEPDLVVTAGTVPQELLDGLASADVDVLALPAPTTLDEAYEQYVDVGIATGHEDEAADLVAEVRADIEELAAQAPEREVPALYYHELDPTLYSVTSSTFLGQLYSLAGLRSVADEADPDGEFGGYPQLSPELIVAADPEFVFLADVECCGETPESFAARPGFGDLLAVQGGNVIQLDDDIASRWGPRIVELLATIVEATAPVPAG